MSAITAWADTRADEAQVWAGESGVTVRFGAFTLALTPEPATALANQLTDAVDELDGK